MSIHFMNDILDSPEPKGVNRMVLLMLADAANDSGVCWPGVDYIARRAATTRRSVQRSLRELEAAGFVRVEINAGTGHFKNLLTNRYVLNWKRGDALSPLGATNKAERGDAVSPLGATNTTERGDAVSPKPSGNHQGEPSGNQQAPGRRPASIDLVHAYGDDIGLPFSECDAFFDHYEANGWKQGNRTPLVDWQAACRQWRRRWMASDFGRKNSFKGSGPVEGPTIVHDFDDSKPYAHTGGVEAAN